MMQTLQTTDVQSDERSVTPLRVFCSYSHRDEDLLDRLRAHLRVLEREGLIVPWHDRMIGAGREWEDEIDEHLETAQVVLLLITADFVASDYCFQKELRRALEKHEAGQARVIPIIVRPADWQGAPFGRLQALPRGARPVTTWANRDEAWTDVVRGIRAAVKELMGAGLEPAPAPVSPPAPRSPSPSAGAPPPERPDSRSARVGLDALAELARLATVRDAIGHFRADFVVACEKINRLGAYKQLHDFFQQLEDDYKLIYQAGKRLLVDDTAWDDVERIEPELQSLVVDLLDYGGRTPFAVEEALWMQRLGRARTELRASVETYDPTQLRNATRRLNEVLARDPSRINTRLVDTAGDLRLSDLATAMAVVRDSLVDRGPDKAAGRHLDQFRDGVDALIRLDASLRTMVTSHNCLQAIDDELRRVEAFLDDDVGEVRVAWQDLSPMMQTVRAGGGSEWATKLSDAATELESALLTDDSPKIKRSFRRYRSQEVRSFNHLDYELLTLCEELQRVGEPLSRVLLMVQDE